MARKRTIDLKGQNFGKLIVLGEDEPYICLSTGRSERKWKCVCSCGEYVSVKQSSLRSGKTRSCGCLQRRNRNGMFRKIMHK